MTQQAGSSGNLRYIIYGAGAIGGILGGYLALSGKDVVMVARPGHVEAIRKNGLKLMTPNGTHELKVNAVTSPREISFKPGDVVLLTVKSQDTGAALRDLKAVVEEIPVFCFQNGIRNEETTSRYFKQVYGVRVGIGGVFVTNGEVTSRTVPPGAPTMGRYPTGTDSLVETVAADLRAAGFRVLVTPDIMPYKWGQIISNLANAVTAITSSPNDDNRTIIDAARAEAQDIMTRAGIKWVSEDEFVRQWPDGKVKIVHSRFQNSTWQSLTRRQGTVETDFFNGEIVRLAGKAGVPAPVNGGLLRIVQEMASRKETPGKYDVPQLSKLLGLA
ncbi:MAG: 2-dehydropantoate 2-reductase [Chloroflexota bacterium]